MIHRLWTIIHNTVSINVIHDNRLVLFKTRNNELVIEKIFSNRDHCPSSLAQAGSSSMEPTETIGPAG